MARILAEQFAEMQQDPLEFLAFNTKIDVSCYYEVNFDYLLVLLQIIFIYKMQTYLESFFCAACPWEIDVFVDWSTAQKGLLLPYNVATIPLAPEGSSQSQQRL